MSDRRRICIVGQASAWGWMPHLVSAFQRVGDICTIGPIPGSNPRAAVPGPWPPPNHVTADLDTIRTLYDVLPEGWHPDLLVAISGGGVPMFIRTADLPCPTVFYSVDTWQCYMDYLEALHYDLVFAGQRAYVPLLRAAGSRHVLWLPMACDPTVHKPVESRRIHDVVFVGGTSEPVHWQRRKLLEALRSSYSVLALEHIYGESMCRAFATGQISFNHSAVEDVNMRIFEALGMGCALLTNRQSVPNGLLDLFEDGTHLVTYADEPDLLRKASQLLANSPQLERLRIEGRREVLARHTYDHRVQTILKTVDDLFPASHSMRRNQPDGGTLIDYLPRAPGRVLDFGMGARTSKRAVAAKGATLFAGYSVDPHLRRQRAGSFDFILGETNGTTAEEFDTVLMEEVFTTLDNVRRGWLLLVEGGSLVARIDPGRWAGDYELEEWFRAQDFHLVGRHVSCDGTLVVVARKRTRRLQDIAREVCERLRVPGVDAEAVAAMIPPSW